MAIVDDVKCPRCDRKYSGVRSRCPYCGARRLGFGKYSKDTDSNAKGKMMISVLILAVLTVAAGIMLFTTPAADAIEEVAATPTTSPEDDVNYLEGLGPTATPEATVTPTPLPSVESIAIFWASSPIADNSFTRWVNHDSNGGPLSGFTVRVEPLGLGLDVEIESSDTEVFTVERTSEDPPYNFTVHPVGPGNANLIATCGEKTATVRVNVPG